MKELLSKMTLREKIGQTGIPSPSALRKGAAEAGSYLAYFHKHPFSGLYVEEMLQPDGTPITKAQELKPLVLDLQKNLPFPLLVTIDAEFGGGCVFEDLTWIPTNMAIGAANDPALTYKRSYYWAKELRSAGINCVFGPDLDLLPDFHSSAGIRCISDCTERVIDLVPELFRGIRDAGMLSTAKHYPGKDNDYRDPHFSMCENKSSLEEWEATQKQIWIAAVNAGADAFMPGHPAFLALDDSFARGKIRRPATASRKTLDVLRKDIGFEGLIISDAVNMKALSSAFEHDDVYIECFNAGIDIVLFTQNDYIDVMEKAIAGGRVSIERLDESVERILRYKAKAGLFSGDFIGPEMTESDMEAFSDINYQLCAKAATLQNNFTGRIPLDPAGIKKAAVIVLAPDDRFHKDLEHIRNAFGKYGISAEIVPVLNSKTQLKNISEENDLIIYACYLGPDSPYGFPGYSQRREVNTLFHGLSFGSQKSIIVSFGSPTVYYNYFEQADAFIHMYTPNKESMDALVDGIFGKFPFTGACPVSLYPKSR